MRALCEAPHGVAGARRASNPEGGGRSRGRERRDDAFPLRQHCCAIDREAKRHLPFPAHRHSGAGAYWVGRPHSIGASTIGKSVASHTPSTSRAKAEPSTPFAGASMRALAGRLGFGPPTNHDADGLHPRRARQRIPLQGGFRRYRIGGGFSLPGRGRTGEGPGKKRLAASPLPGFVEFRSCRRHAGPLGSTYGLPLSARRGKRRIWRQLQISDRPIAGATGC